ncbi:MAG: hypothetical protein WDO71_18370 [Bacteroidota bacterium]
MAAAHSKVVNLEEGKPYLYNGLEYSYYISNESSKEVKGEDYERYEVNLVVTNTSGCLKLIPFKSGWTGSTSSEDDVMIAEFNCTNANGKRLTSKKVLSAPSPGIPVSEYLMKQRRINIKRSMPRLDMH